MRWMRFDTQSNPELYRLPAPQQVADGFLHYADMPGVDGVTGEIGFGFKLGLAGQVQAGQALERARMMFPPGQM